MVFCCCPGTSSMRATSAAAMGSRRNGMRWSCKDTQRHTTNANQRRRRWYDYYLQLSMTQATPRTVAAAPNNINLPCMREYFCQAHLSGVSEVRDDGRDALGRCPPHGADREKQLNDTATHRTANTPEMS